MQIKALKSLLTNRYSTCTIVACGSEVLLNHDQFQKNQKWHSVDLNLEDQSYIHNLIANLHSTKMRLAASSCNLQ